MSSKKELGLNLVISYFLYKGLISKINVLGLTPRHRATLQKCFIRLLECRHAKGIIEALYTKRIISERQYNTLLRETSDFDVMSHLVTEIILRGTIEEYDATLDVIRLNDRHLANMIDTTYQCLTEGKLNFEKCGTMSPYVMFLLITISNVSSK